MRKWTNECKNKLIERIKKEVAQEATPEISEVEKEERIDKKFNEELQDIYNKIIEKAQFLIKLNVPEAFLA